MTGSGMRAAGTGGAAPARRRPAGGRAARGRRAAASALVTAAAVAVLAGCGGTPSVPLGSGPSGAAAGGGQGGQQGGQAGGQQGGAVASTAGAVASGAGSGSGAGGRPRVLVAVRGSSGVQGSGALVVLDPGTGVVGRTLDATGVVGDAVQLAPDGTVYYEKATGCRHEVWTAPVTGGTARKLVEGSRPALSPDGSRLAYSTQVRGDGCYTDTSARTYAVAVRTLQGGATVTLPLEAPQLLIPSPVEHLSWSPDGARLAVSIGSAQDNEGWGLRVVDPAKDRYYLGEKSAGVDVRVAATEPAGRTSFFREGVFLPDGTFFVVHRCCIGGDPYPRRSEALEIVDAKGKLVKRVATGSLTADHTGLDADVTGHWLLYLAGDKIMISHDGATPATLATGFQAAAW